jgi:hypothetical protein
MSGCCLVTGGAGFIGTAVPAPRCRVGRWSSSRPASPGPSHPVCPRSSIRGRSSSWRTSRGPPGRRSVAPADTNPPPRRGDRYRSVADRGLPSCGGERSGSPGCSRLAATGCSRARGADQQPRGVRRGRGTRGRDTPTGPADQQTARGSGTSPVPALAFEAEGPPAAHERLRRHQLAQEQILRA